MTDLKNIIANGAKDDIHLLKKVTMCLVDELEEHLDQKEYLDVCKKVYCKTNGGHFNKEFADMQIPKMYYEDKGDKEYAPYYTEESVRKVYDNLRDRIPKEYNFYDFEVAINMIHSDYFPLLCDWSEEIKNTTTLPAEWVDRKIQELTLNWLNDEDNPFGTEKVWRYFNSGGGKG